MERREPPQTEEGWYALHDFRTIDWDAWRAAPEAVRERAIGEGTDYLRRHEALADIEAGDAENDGEGSGGASAVFAVLGHEADLMVLHLRPSMADVERAERRFERTKFGDFTDHTDSFVSVTEASGYTTDLDDEEMDAGLRRYIDMRLHPTLPDAEYVCFYPMDKRRGEVDNWYDLPFDERAGHMSAHGDIGRKYAGKVVQVVTGSVGFDDWEWGVTLFSDDPAQVKQLLYEMRFDPSTSRYAEFGPFYFGRRFPPADLGAYMAGEAVPSAEEGIVEETAAADDAAATGDAAAAGARVGPADGASADGGTEGESIDPSLGPAVEAIDDSIEAPDGAYAVLVESEADESEVGEAVDGLRGNFDHYDTHVATSVGTGEDLTAVASVWENERAADTAAGFLADLPGVTDHRVGPVGADGNGGGSDGNGSSAAEAREASTNEAAVAGTDDTDDDIRGELEDLDIYAGQPHGEDVYAMVLYSEHDADELETQVDDLRANFAHYDTHVKTAVYAARGGGRAAIVSIWETRKAADTAGGFLADLPEIVSRAGEESGFGTMGMFYTIKPEYREEFVTSFDGVTDLLADMDGHLETDLLVNRADENDTFISSQWRSREDAMDFFRSDAFRETVSQGRDMLTDRPRHVFLA
jgi:chlorite dismutase